MTTPVDPPNGYGTFVRSAPTVLIGMPLMLIGILLCASIVGIPLGVPFILLASWPLYRVQTRAVLDNDAYENRHRHL